MVFGDMSCTVFVGQAVNKIDEMVDRGGLAVHQAKIGKL